MTSTPRLRSLPPVRDARRRYRRVPNQKVLLLPGRCTDTRIAAAALFVALILAALATPAGAQSGLERGELRDVQRTLNDLGYEAGPEDGLYGDRTAEAIRAFERANGIEPTGAADAELLDRLRAASTAEKRDTGSPEPSGDTERTDGKDTSSGPPAIGRGSDDPAATGGSEAGPGRQGNAQPDTAVPDDARPGAQARGDGAGDPEAPSAAGTRADTAALSGTRWRVRDESGSTFTVTFQPEGRLEGPTVGGDWRWTRRGDRLVIEFEAGPGMSTRRTAPWPGERGAINGTARSSAGQSWTWKAEKIDGSER